MGQAVVERETGQRRKCGIARVDNRLRRHSHALCTN